MGLFDFTQSRGWKVFIAKLYGLGASVVIVGALFKIQHYPGAGFMLAFGLITEAVIFFFSAFEPLPHETDWEIVFPELLVGVDDADILDPAKKEKKQRLIEKINKVHEKDELASCWPGGGAGTSAQSGPANTGNALAAFDSMLQKCGGQNFFEKMGNNFANFNEKVKDMADIADSAAASKQFATNLQGASIALEGVKSSAESLQGSVDSMSNTYSKLASNMDNIDFSALKSGNQEYSSNITALNKNLGAINQIFEIQMQEVDFDTMISELKGSVQYAQQYSQEVSKLSKNLSALNTVYGNMLTALNVKVS